jgi:hypothetical protein
LDLAGSAASTGQLPSGRSAWTNWISALGCQGHPGLEFLLSTPSLPAILPVFYGIPAPSRDGPSSAAFCAPAAVCLSPPVPPPRLMAA